MDDGGDLMVHETPYELDAISSWIAPGLCLSRMELGSINELETDG